MERPFVYVNMAMSADGKITSVRREYPKFTSAKDKKTMDRLRAEADAVLVGAGTLRADDPPLQIRDAEMRAYRASLGRPPGLRTVVVSGSLNVAPDSRFFRNEPEHERIVVTTEEAPADREAALQDKAAVWRIGRGGVDLPALLSRLRGLGVERLLVEGGGETNWSLLRHDLVDELYITIAPCIFGGRQAPTPVEGEGFPMSLRRPLRLVSIEREGDELYTRWAVDR